MVEARRHDFRGIGVGPARAGRFQTALQATRPAPVRAKGVSALRIFFGPLGGGGGFLLFAEVPSWAFLIAGALILAGAAIAMPLRP